MSSPSFDCPFEKLVILGVSAFPAQARLWPELAGTPAVPTITDAAVEAMADDFERRFRTQLVDVFSPAGLRRIWTDIGLSYIRFSDEGSNPRSLDQQLINVLQRARRDGVFIPWHSICADYAVSGTLACRRGYIVAKMLVERRAETGVAWFIIDDLGRMNRNALESLRLGEFVEATQVRLIGASDGFDSSNQQSKIMLAMMSSFNEVFIDQLKAKVHRGQSDTFRRGGIVQHPGFGYRLVDVLSDDGKPVLTRKGTIQKRVEIDPDAAEWIVRGAGMIVRDNRSPGAVAVVFNDNNVGGTRTWSSNRIRRLYARERLVGIEVFRKTKQVRDRDTGHVDVVPNDRGEWMTRECPEMRILSDELAEAVKAKLRSCETLSTFTGRESGRQAGAMAGGGVRASPTSRSCRSIRRRGPKSARTAARRVPAATSDAGRRGRRSTRRVAEHLEGWLENRTVAEQPVSAHVERELRSYLTCGILCFGFGRARCASCGQGFVVAFSCKGRGVCPSCNGRRMAQTAAHLVDRVIPPVPVRQWVISVPKRLRGFLADRPQAVAALTRIFL
ncbi:MAG: transposase zinc-binding domain-containing protein, partial [Pirellulales bacterium]